MIDRNLHSLVANITMYVEGPVWLQTCLLSGHNFIVSRLLMNLICSIILKTKENGRAEFVMDLSYILYLQRNAFCLLTLVLNWFFTIKCDPVTSLLLKYRIS